MPAASSSSSGSRRSSPRNSSSSVFNRKSRSSRARPRPLTQKEDCHAGSDVSGECAPARPLSHVQVSGPDRRATGGGPEEDGCAEEEERRDQEAHRGGPLGEAYPARRAELYTGSPSTLSYGQPM